MAITAEMVKKLRDKTGAGMLDCKKALNKVNGDFEAAIDELRKSGVAKAEKKAGRSTKEGRVFVAVKPGKAAAIEVLCETDFVSKNEKFNDFATGIVNRVVEYDADGDVSESARELENANVVGMISTIGENMQLRRAVAWKTGAKVGTYLHMGGRIGVMVEVEGEIADDILSDLCMHIAAFSPLYIDSDSIPAAVIAREKEIAVAQLSGKPQDIIDKIVMGKINKWYTEVCVNRQPWLKDDKSCFAKVAPKARIKRFIRWQVGEEL
ncbi:MAG: translation elongation factor Ts [Victivallales bacterium]|nr:translation elongation factor Ts [Victivallales bacterium]